MAIRSRAAFAATNRAIRVIALTGYGQDEDKQRACAAGFDVHLVKPVDIAALRSALGASAPLLMS